MTPRRSLSLPLRAGSTVTAQTPVASSPRSPQPALPVITPATVLAPEQSCATRQPEKLVAENVPIISDRSRAEIRDEYLPAPGHKALAVSVRRIAFLTGQPDDRSCEHWRACRTCQRLTDESPGPPLKCELFAVGDMVVSSRAHPPMPPQPWLMRNACYRNAVCGRGCAAGSTRRYAARSKGSTCRVADPRRWRCRRAAILDCSSSRAAPMKPFAARWSSAASMRAFPARSSPSTICSRCRFP